MKRANPGPPVIQLMNAAIRALRVLVNALLALRAILRNGGNDNGSHQVQPPGDRRKEQRR